MLAMAMWGNELNKRRDAMPSDATLDTTPFWYTVDVYRYKTIESIGKNFVTFVHKFFHIDSIGITYECTRKNKVKESQTGSL